MGLPVPKLGPMLEVFFGLAGPFSLGFFFPIVFLFFKLPIMLPIWAFLAIIACLRAAALAAQAFFLASFSKYLMVSDLGSHLLMEEDLIVKKGLINYNPGLR